MRRLVETVEANVAPLFAGATLPELVFVALLAGLSEEALFRGVVQDALTGVLPWWAALAAASLLFGVAHWVTTTYVVLAGLIGLYLGGLYRVTGNLLAPVTTHALYDVVALLVLVRLKPASSRSVV